MEIKDKIRLRRLALGLTLDEVASKVGVTKSTVKKWETGQIASMRQTKIAALAKTLGVKPTYFIYEDDEEDDIPEGRAVLIRSDKYPNILPVTTKRVPLLGRIACGEPIYADEERESYVEAGTTVQADFCLKAVGDSMTGARIYDGDVVFIRAQDSVRNGEIAAVIVDDSATLKRVFYYADKGKLILQAENPAFPPLVYIGEELNQIHILGKAIAFQSDVR